MPGKKRKGSGNQQGQRKKQAVNAPTKSQRIASSLKIAQPAAKSTNRSNYFRLSDASSNRHPDAVRIQGQDFLTSINGTSEAAGANVYNEIINPLTGVFDNTRLSRFAELYEKFLFKDLRFHYEPVCPTTTAGGLIVAYDRDPSDATPAASDHGLHQYYAMMGARSGPVWDNITINCPLSDTQEFYYGNARGGDERLFAQGQIYVSATSALPTAPLGMLWLEYDVILFDPQLEEKDTALEANLADTNQSNTTKTGFNGLTADADSIGTAASLKVDSSGNTFFHFPTEGVYQILTEWTNTGTSTGLTLQPFVDGILDTSKRSVLLGTSGTSAANATLINVPRQGLDLYSQWSSAWTGGAGDLQAFVNNVPSEAFTIF
jgi:hypothetical protein